MARRPLGFPSTIYAIITIAWLAIGLVVLSGAAPARARIPVARAVPSAGVASALSPQPSAQAPAQVDQDQLRAVCGTCHVVPPPEILPSSRWRDEFIRMLFIRENRLPPVGPPATVNRMVQLPPDMQAVLPYFTTRAPEHLAAPEPWPEPSESPVQFVRRAFSVPDMPNNPAMSNVQMLDFDGDKRLDLIGTDMRQGLVVIGYPSRGSTLSPIASIPHPAHATVTDLDGDGTRDLIVGDLGTFFPADHDKGAVIWLRGLPNGRFGALWLDGWPRVADVQPADFNGDGKNDVAVAAFGWRKTGNVTILENRSTDYSQPTFTGRALDPRTGAINAVPVDLDKDGHMDLVVLLAQEHETVVAYINTGKKDFTFEQKVLYTAPHPNWGSSGIQVVDLDKDGDPDVLFTNGDTFDDGLVKPYHGIQWLENTGAYPFVYHHLAQMAGVHRAQAADLDGDGDLDIAVAALLAGGSDVDEKTLPALGWLEQTKPGTFVKHTIEMGFPRHATLDIGDIDGDGDVDIATGYFAVDRPAPAWIEVWENLSKKK